MTVHDPLSESVDIDALLLTKRLEPLPPQHLATLQKIAALNVSTYSEMEVRSFVIDPIVAILGYEKGTVFSPMLEHRITFLGKHIFPDYQFALWNENFWLIEAKKPRLKKAKFDAKDLRQGIEYSVHPTINASLVVLCDGVKLEIFDREVDVEAPLVRDDSVRSATSRRELYFQDGVRSARASHDVANRTGHAGVIWRLRQAEQGEVSW